MTKPSSIIFLGTPEFAIPSLRALAKAKNFSVVLAVTQPDKPSGRKQTVTPPPVKICAEKLGIKVIQPISINADFGILKQFKPDFIVSAAYGQILTQEVLEIPEIASINIHPSLLPRWRGASPIQNAILAGDEETGVTVQMMTEELDAGDILGQESVPIGERETYGSLHDKLVEIAAELLIKTLSMPLQAVRQKSPLVKFCAKLSREDGKIDINKMTAEEIDRRVRALNPWPGVLCNLNGNEIKILETSLSALRDSVPIDCAKGTVLYLVKLLPPGKKPMSAAEWERGTRN